MKKPFAILILTILIITSLSLFVVSPVKAQTYWAYRFLGPYYDSGELAAGVAVTCTIRWINGSMYTFDLTSDSGELLSIYAATQISWNASTTLNYTRFIDFRSGFNNTSVYIFIPNPSSPYYLYTFPVTDFYGMTNPYLKTSISTNGADDYIIEQVSLNGTGTPTFLLQQYRTYTLTFICNQGTYSQQFTTENTFSTTLQIAAGNFPQATTSEATATAERLNATTIDLTYADPDSITTSLVITITHMDGVDTVTDYTTTEVTQSYSAYITVDNATDYYVQMVATRSGATTEWHFACPVLTGTNPFTGLFDYLGTWPTGLDPTQIVATVIIMFCLGLGSFRSAGVSCILAIVIAGIFIAIGWFTMSIPMFALTFVLGMLVVLTEGKETTRDA